MGVDRYLSREILNGFDHYKYSSVDVSPISTYLCHPFWNWVIQLVPKWVAPNLLTFSGFLFLQLYFFVSTYYDPFLYAVSHDYPQYIPPPNWIWIAGAVTTFLSHTLDGIDGKQARRTGTSSPLGELFDHGIDSWSTFFLPIGLCSAFGRGEHGVSACRMYLILIAIMACFIISHWEKYNTGILFLPLGYDLSQMSMIIFYVVTFFGTFEMWKFTIPQINMTACEVVEAALYVGVVGLTFPVTFYNIYRSYKNKTGKMLSFWESFRVLIPTIILFFIMTVWVVKSPSDILDRDPRLFCWCTSTVFSNMACHLIVAQMSNTRCLAFNRLLIPLLVIVPSIILLQLPSNIEYFLLWGYTIIATFTHVSYGIGVVQEMCDHFNIYAFSIPKANQK